MMNTYTSKNLTPPKTDSGIDWKIVFRLVIAAVLIPVLLFVAAGRLDWWQGWLYAILTLGMSLVSRYIVFFKAPDLITERARFTESEGVKSWDKPLVVALAIIGPLIFMIVAGLDKRFDWSAEMSLPVQLSALAIFLMGFVLVTWAMIENTFFSSVVRIQIDRGQTVVTSGPYRFVRHPGYAGGIVAWLVSPILLGSFGSFIPAGIVIVLYVVRTALEDKTLQDELPGYKEYAQRTRYRLLPGIW